MNKQVITINGTVTAVNGATAKVLVERTKTHPKYNKSYKVSRNFHAHIDERQNVTVGDDVTLIPSKKISKMKAWLIK